LFGTSLHDWRWILFIAIEGADANGKATQSTRVCEALGGRKVGTDLPYLGRCALYSFPRYETPLGKAILRHLKREISVIEEPHGWKAEKVTAPEDAMIFQCMMTIDKYIIAPEIISHLRSGLSVVADRWTVSAEIYGWLDGLDLGWLEAAQAMLPKADVNIYLEVPVEESIRRRPKLRDRYEEDIAGQHKIRARYREVWETRAAFEGQNTWAIVDGVGGVEEVTQRIMHVIVMKSASRR